MGSNLQSSALQLNALTTKLCHLSDVISETKKVLLDSSKHEWGTNKLI